MSKYIWEKRVKEYWGLHIGPNSSQQEQEGVLVYLINNAREVMMEAFINALIDKSVSILDNGKDKYKVTLTKFANNEVDENI